MMRFDLEDYSSLKSRRLNLSDPDNAPAVDYGNTEEPLVVALLLLVLLCLIGLSVRLACYGAPSFLSGGQQMRSQGESHSERDEQRQRRKEWIEQALITKKVMQALDDDDSNAIPEESADCETDDNSVDSGESFHGGEKKPHLLFLETGERLDDDSRTCPICLYDYKEGENMVLSRNQKCRHTFHQSCVVPWLMKHSECPCCRSNYLAPPNPEKDQHKESPSPPESATVLNDAQPHSAAVLNGTQQNIASSEATVPLSRYVWLLEQMGHRISRLSHDDSGYESGDETDDQSSTSAGGATREATDDLESQIMEMMREARVGTIQTPTSEASVPLSRFVQLL